ncbi:MAG TPA: tetratricopeptide repeat protein [Gemmatimonadaceae bacterium]|nr:tetratricopeptide repeat protein [Gemmatimonadaceae bacterium]
MLRTLHSRTFALGTLVPFSLFAVAACGGSGDSVQKPATDTVAGAPSVVAQPGTTVATGAVAPNTVTYAQADSVFRMRDYANAATMFAAYTERRPENPWGHYMLGLSDWKSGQLDSARAAFEDALKLDPTHVKSMINLARVLLDEDSAADALPRVQQAIALDSGSTDAWRVLGRVQAQLRNTDAALDAYHTALALDPSDVWSMNNMGLLLIRSGRYDEALGPLARAVQLDEHGVASFRNNLGVALERTGHYTLAADAYRQALDADSSYSKASSSLARVNGREDEPGIEPVTVASLGDAFAKEVDAWHSTGDVAVVPRAAVKPDSVKP